MAQYNNKSLRSGAVIKEYSEIIAEKYPQYSPQDIARYIKSNMEYIKQFMLDYEGEKHSFKILFGKHFAFKNTDAYRRRKDYYDKYICKIKD